MAGATGRLGTEAVPCCFSPFWMMRFSKTSIWSAGRDVARVEARALPAVAVSVVADELAAAEALVHDEGPPSGWEVKGVAGMASSRSGAWVLVGAWAASERERSPSIGAIGKEGFGEMRG